VAILDVDYHHGNGTQTIFYARDDVLTINLHADPLDEYPYFLGQADEIGEGSGEGYNHNYPLALETDWSVYQVALRHALRDIVEYSPDGLVVSLGLDTFVGDPTTHLGLTSDDYRRMGEMIGGLNLPTLSVLEGGYSVEHIGTNAVNFLEELG
jgi:acetoin utilization deacetylase AcuC-like enzyme